MAICDLNIILFYYEACLVLKQEYVETRLLSWKIFYLGLKYQQEVNLLHGEAQLHHLQQEYCLIDLSKG